MNRGVVVLVAFLLAAAVLAVPSSAQAQTTCDPGFALTAGGVPEADLNADGLTCEVTSVDSATGDSTTLALDNAPADPAVVHAGCPDGSSGFYPSPWGMGVDPDRNGDSLVCVKSPKMMKVRDLVIIDNNVPCDPDKDCPH
jgi:hypothetical protein